MYHVIETTSISILLYLLSYFFHRTGVYSIHVHKKIWNSILAAAFLLTALAGLFIALQINYKWNIPVMKPVLKWHAEFGIGLAVTGIFHLIWHYSYFMKLFTPSVRPVKSMKISKVSASDISLNLFIVGLISSSFQLLLLREMMNITGGYELIAGIFLGSWLIGSAAGSSLAERSGLSDLKKINMIFAISPLISLLFLFLMTSLFLNTGETPSFLTSIIFTFLINLPFCLASGLIFVKLTSAARDQKDFLPGKSFSTETIGGIIAGLLIPVLTSGLMNTYQVILLLVLMSLAYVTTSFFIASKWGKTATLLVISILASAVIIFNPDLFFRQLLLPAGKVISSEDTPYGNITETEYKGEKSIYYNQRLIDYNSDIAEREENIHYPMLQREKPEKVIVISGPLISHLAEILKYPVEKVTYIERDPVLSKIFLEKTKYNNINLVVKNTDALRSFEKDSDRADVVILLISPPATLMLNRYYTTDFFTLVKKILKKGGVFVCSPGPADLYLNKGALNLCSSVNNSLSSVFKYVRPVPGNKLYFLASDEEISVSFCELVEKRGIKNIYVSSDYLSDDIIKVKSAGISSQLDPKVKQNRNIKPVGFFYQQLYNLSKNNNEKIPALLVLAAVFALPVFTIKKGNKLMFFSASALAGFEIISIFMLQIIAGNMYQLTGLIVSGLMTGLAVGAGYKIRFPGSVTVRGMGISLALFYAFSAILYNFMPKLTSEPFTIVLIIISVFIPALITGQLFRELTTDTAGKSRFQATYSADLAGSAFGFILITGFVVPILGLTIGILISALLIFTGILFGTVGNK